MNRFGGDRLFEIGSLFGSMRIALDLTAKSANVNFSDLDGANIEKWLNQIKDACVKTALTQSAKFAHRIINSDLRSGIAHRDLSTKLMDLRRLVESEMEECVFLHVDAGHVEYYVQKHPLFGEVVQKAFPSATYEIAEAGKSIALDRNTAAVCHLMRALEFGLRALAVRLSVKFDGKPWNYVIEVAAKRVNTIRQQKRKPRNWKVDEKFYSEALTHFRFLKDSWRNYSMHVYERYDEPAAVVILTHAKAFLQHLATKLKEEKS